MGRTPTRLQMIDCAANNASKPVNLWAVGQRTAPTLTQRLAVVEGPAEVAIKRLSAST